MANSIYTLKNTQKSHFEEWLWGSVYLTNPYDLNANPEFPDVPGNAAADGQQNNGAGSALHSGKPDQPMEFLLR